MSHGRSSSINDHFYHCFIVFKHVQQSFLTRRIGRLREHIQQCPNHWSLSEIAFVLKILWGVEQTSRWFGHKSPRSWLLCYVFPWRTATIISHKSRASNPSNLNPVSKDMISDSVELCEAAVCFLHIQLMGTKCMTFKNAQCSTWCRFWILKISCNIGVFKQSQSALCGSVSHMTILFVITCMMNVRNQTR